MARHVVTSLGLDVIQELFRILPRCESAVRILDIRDCPPQVANVGLDVPHGFLVDA